MFNVSERAYEVGWVLLASAGINILTALPSGNLQRAWRASGAVGLVLSGIAFYVVSEAVREIRARALMRQAEVQEGAFSLHLREVLEEPGYRSKRRHARVALVCAICFFTVGMVFLIL